MKIQQQISKLNGLTRVCSIGQIAYMDFDIEEAKIRFDVTITSLGITQSQWSVISNSNRVTEQGVMITREFTDSTFEEPEELEEGQTIEQLKEEHYQEYYNNGIPEFTFWWESAKEQNLEEALKEGILLLDSFKTFG